MLDWLSSVIPADVLFGGGLAIIGSVIGASLQHRYTHRRNVRDTVYRPLFDETHRISTHGELPYDPTKGSFKSIYRDLDAYQKFYAKSHIGGQMVMVEGKLNTLERLIPVYRYHLEEVFEDTEYARFDGDNNILFVDSDGGAPHKFTTEEWAQYFYMPFVYTKDRSELRENLEEYCWENLSEYIVTIEKTEEEFLDRTWRALQIAEKSQSSHLHTGSTYEDYKSTKKRARMISKELGIGALGVFDEDHGDKDSMNG